MAKILVVDDDTDSVRLFARILEMAGHTVHVAETVRDAKYRFDHTFDLLITDIHLPDGSGYDINEYVATHFKRAKRIAFSGVDQIHGDFTVKLQKPLMPDLLLKIISSVGDMGEMDRLDVRPMYDFTR